MGGGGERKKKKKGLLPLNPNDICIVVISHNYACQEAMHSLHLCSSLHNNLLNSEIGKISRIISNFQCLNKTLVCNHRY